MELSGAKFGFKLGCPYERYIRIPPLFREKFLTPVPRHVTLSLSDGAIWVISIHHYKGFTTLSEGWSLFRKHYGLKQGDLIGMSLHEDSHFEVIVYLKVGIQLKPPLDPENVGIAAYRVVACPTETVDEVAFTGLTDSDNDAEELPDIIEAGVPYRPNVNTEQDIDPVYQYRVFVTHCYVKLTWESVSPRFHMVLPRVFAGCQLLDGHSERILARHGVGVWPIVCAKNGVVTIIVSGWRQFVEANELEIGDECCIEQHLVSGNTWNVTVLKAAASAQ